MKVERKEPPKVFEPITIIIETQEEFNEVFGMSVYYELHGPISERRKFARLLQNKLQLAS